MQTRHVGRIRFTTLDDGNFPFPARMFFANVEEAQWRARVAANDEGKIPVGHNMGLIEDGERVIVIDTGYGDDTHDGRTGHMLADLARAGRAPEEVDTVVLTHGHGDHVKGNTKLQDGAHVPVFPHARYLLARAEYDWFGGAGHVPEFDEQIAPLAQQSALDLFDGERTLAPGISLLPTPGHTPGHISVLIESEGNTALFLGDICHHPLHFSHPDWVSSFDVQPDLTPHTREWLFKLAVQRDALLVCPHTQAPGFGRLEPEAGGYCWQALQ